MSSSTTRPGEDQSRSRIREVLVKESLPRSTVPILRDFSATVMPGETVALVGASGSGKSTCVQLIQRMYDPLEGQVMVDDEDIKDLNLGWLRDLIGVVGQEPVLFGCSIRENIVYGKPNATDDDIWQACRDANAYDFISKLPKVRMNPLTPTQLVKHHFRNWTLWLETEELSSQVSLDT